MQVRSLSQVGARDPDMISRTCFFTAAGRAVGAREPDLKAQNPDYLAEKLLGDRPELVLAHPCTRALAVSYGEAMSDAEVVGLVRSMTNRTRCIDEVLQRAVADGVAHVVILGAGLDSRAYRFRDRLAGVRVFE